MFKRNSWFELQVEAFELLCILCFCISFEFCILYFAKFFLLGKRRANTRRETANDFQCGQCPNQANPYTPYFHSHIHNFLSLKIFILI